MKHYQHFMDKQDDMIMHWLGFAAASLVAMMAAARLWQDDYICQKPVHKAEHFCRRSFFTFVFGALSGIVAVFMAFTNVKKLQFPLSFLLFVAWCCAAGYDTFKDGPAVTLATFYFATWASVILALKMAAKSLHELLNRDKTEEPTPQEVQTETGKSDPVPEQPKAEHEEVHEHEEVEETAEAKV